MRSCISSSPVQSSPRLVLFVSRIFVPIFGSFFCCMHVPFKNYPPCCCCCTILFLSFSINKYLNPIPFPDFLEKSDGRFMWPWSIGSQIHRFESNQSNDCSQGATRCNSYPTSLYCKFQVSLMRFRYASEFPLHMDSSIFVHYQACFWGVLHDVFFASALLNSALGKTRSELNSENSNFLSQFRQKGSCGNLKCRKRFIK